MDWIQLIFIVARSLVRDQMELAAENLALRQQLAVLERQSKRPKLRKRDRIFWVWLARFWSNWKSVLFIVQPDTVVRWHKQGFKLYWRWKSKPKKIGRPQVWREIRVLVRRMCIENPTWVAPRIHSELQLLGYDVPETSVDNHIIRDRNLVKNTEFERLDGYHALRHSFISILVAQGKTWDQIATSVEYHGSKQTQLHPLHIQ